MYKCSVCGYIYDETKQGIPWNDLESEWKCPVCEALKSKFVKQGAGSKTKVDSLDYLREYKKEDISKEPYMNLIQSMAMGGETIIDAMATDVNLVSWKDILIKGAQLNPMPLDKNEDVNLKTIIGMNAKKPMILETPIYVSHMSFGSLSKEMKIALAKGSSKAKTATSSGEGGILPEEMDSAYKYIFEYVPNKYSVTKENLLKSDAIEIKIGQGTKPGMGGHLPGDKVTEEIARIRDKEVGKDIISPSKFEEISSKEDLKELVETLRDLSEGRPIGVKIAAGHIESDIEFASYAKPDFITIDGRGGATGASPKILRDSTSVPTIFALYRAKEYLDKNNLNIDLIITGGLRISSDFAKAIAIGAKAVCIATSALIAAGCQQYRICDSGRCPVGCATQNPELRKRLKIDKSAERVYNFFKVSSEELKTFGRITGKNDIHKLDVNDLCTTNSEISNYTEIKHV